MRFQHAEGPECRARSEASRPLCHASSISCRRLRNMDVRRAGPTSHVAAQELRIRHVGWRDPCRVRASARRDRCNGALVFQWLCQHRSRFAAQEAWHPSAHRHRSHRAYLHRGDRSLCGELGYEVTVVKDATADYSDKEMRAALDVNIPNYASAIVTTNEVVDSISSL